jgi:hypothetical protein
MVLHNMTPNIVLNTDVQHRRFALFLYAVYFYVGLYRKNHKSFGFICEEY